MNVAYINPFLSATIDLFEQTFGVTPKAAEPYLDERATSHRWDISAIMVLTGNAIGVIAIRLTRVLADKLLIKSGIKWDTDDEREKLINDMVGELVNIIASQASGNLSDYNIKVSVPIVIQGQNHTVSWPEQQPIIAVPFSMPIGQFLVDICLFELPKQYRS